MRNIAGLNHGNPGNKGGGRPANWVRAKAADLVDKHKLLNFLADVAAGKVKDHRLSKDGDVIEIDASISDRIEAAQYLIDHAGGKAPQAVWMSGDDGQPLVMNLVNFAGAAALALAKNGHSNGNHDPS